jgi:gas vesicle protein
MAKFTVGLLAGIAVGLLIAPEPGEETRQNLADTATKWRDQFNRLLGRAGARVDDLRTMLETDMEGMTGDARDKIRAILDELAPENTGSGMSGNRGTSEFAGAGAQQGEFRPI